MLKLKTVLHIAILLVVIQSVYAISNVQHSISENSVTLTYDGTPPFLINIRSDSNVGQNGGYVWAKTHSNSFTVDLSFANNPTGKFYYGVKDDHWSETNYFEKGSNGIQVLNLIASDNPENYLGQRIANEQYSDWVNYQPIINKINELTANKETELDKIKAIIDWVATSKTYGYPSQDTVIDMFESSTGVCADSAVLTTAMLRFIGVPARVVLPFIDIAHGYVQFYLNGEWIGVDNTYGRNENLRQFIYELSTGLSTYQFQDPIISPTGSNVHMYKVDTYNSGEVVYPIMSKYLIDCDQRPCNIIEEDVLGTGITATLNEEMCNHYTCLNCNEFCDLSGQGADCLDWCYGEITKPAYTKRVGIPSFLKTSSEGGIEPSATFVRIKIPGGKYRLEYTKQAMVSGSPIAYTDFELNDNEIVMIGSDNLIKSPEANSNTFNELIRLIQDLE